MNHMVGLATAFFLITPHLAPAHSELAGDLEIIHPNIPEPPESARSAAGYMGISNEGHEADRLIGVETPIAQRASLHSTEHGSDGVARMIQLPDIEIPAGDTVVLEPGGMHIMLMGLTQEVSEGMMIPATLTFDHAGAVQVEFMVTSSDGMDHDAMDHAAAGQSVTGGTGGPAHRPGGAQADRIVLMIGRSTNGD